MLKNLLLLYLGVHILVPNNGKAMMSTEDERFETSYALVNSRFRSLPGEIVLNIGRGLYGEDFQSFSLTCWPIRKIIKKNKFFFMPEEQTDVVETIRRTHIEKVPQLILEWSRTERIKSIPLLRKTLPYFEDFYPQNAVKNLKPFRKNFKNYVKTLNILFAMGDMKNSTNVIRRIYDQIQENIAYTIKCEKDDGTAIFSNPNLYIFHIKNASLLDIETRIFISEKYERGEFPFMKNYYKSKKYRNNLLLPLNTSVFIK